MINACGEQIRRKDKRTTKPACGVLQCDERGEMAFDSAKIAAEEMGVKPVDIYNWIRDGRQHRGFTWKWEQKKG